MYQLAPDLHFSSLSGCFWCLRDIPTERLPCGHWICEACVAEIGEASAHDVRLRLVRQCDQHQTAKILNSPFEFLLLPRNTGRRLLSLDGGGVRGIVELDILAAVQDRLGQGIPVQDCFDLIGGTGVGGVTALGLAIGGWHVSEAVEKFKQLAPCAFTKHSEWSILQRYSKWMTGCTYKFENLKQSIKAAFGTDGGSQMIESMVSANTENL